VSDSSPSFLSRHQFLIYRLFSLSGLIPVGAFLAVHLLTNASVNAGAGVFQSRVDMIHSLGENLLPVVEWLFIFLPMMFHATVGFVIIANGLPNVGSYPYVGNVRYTLQRATGMIAFFFIIGHVIHLHWMGRPLGGGQFDPHAATSSAAVAIHPILSTLLYAVGVLCAVFHFANGLWTLGITWGIWTSPAAMRRANAVSVVIGVALAAAGLSSIVSLRSIGGDPQKLEQARRIERAMDEDRVRRERLLEGEPPVRPAAPAVRRDTADGDILPASAGDRTER
jgi:succinate dehydrogenase / fumarate reductase cytochrome b subunit